MIIKTKNFSISHTNPPYFIADIAANHDGDIKQALKLIELAASSGANAAKFQHFQAETIVSDHGFKSLGSQLSHQKKWKKSVFDTYKDASINLEWTKILKNKCDDCGIDFFTSPYSFELADYVDSFVEVYKIGSGDITWLEYLDYLSKKNKPIFIATGASNLNEVQDAYNVIIKNNKKVILMQCNTNYTASDENFKFINLNVLKTYQKKFPNVILGLSDHTHGSETVLGAIALGARVIEKHFTDNNNKDGPDHKFSMTPKTWEDMVISSNKLFKSLGSGIKEVEDNEKETSLIQRRGLRVSKYLRKGSKLNEKDLIFLRPYDVNSINIKDKSKVIGRKLIRNLELGETIKWEDLE